MWVLLWDPGLQGTQSAKDPGCCALKSIPLLVCRKGTLLRVASSQQLSARNVRRQTHFLETWDSSDEQLWLEVSQSALKNFP